MSELGFYSRHTQAGFDRSLISCVGSTVYCVVDIRYTGLKLSRRSIYRSVVDVQPGGITARW